MRREWGWEEGGMYTWQWEAMPQVLFMALLSASWEIWAFRVRHPPHTPTSRKRVHVSSFSVFLFWL